MSILVLVYGLILGSFLNVCIYRIPAGISIIKPSSSCTKCSTVVKKYDLIPVFSYLFLGGKCRSCRAKISLRYPITEVLTGVLFYLTFLRYGITLEFFKFIIMEGFFIVIGTIDFDTTDVYFKTTLPAFLIGMIFVVYRIFSSMGFLEYILAALIAAFTIFLIVFFTKGMGEGDIEIAAIIGIFLGVRNTLIALFFAVVIAGIFAMVLILNKKKKKKDVIAFGPFLTLGSIIAILQGNEILGWYLNFF